MSAAETLQIVYTFGGIAIAMWVFVMLLMLMGAGLFEREECPICRNKRCPYLRMKTAGKV